MDTPFLRVEDSGEVISLRGEVTTVGRGRGVDIHLDDPSVSRLHAELIRRGPYVYVVDLGLSRNGTRVNGRPVARRVLDEGDVLSFGAARCRIGGIPREDLAEEAELAPGGRARAHPARARRAHLAVPARAVRGGVRHARHRARDRHRPGGDRGRGQAAPAAAIPEVPGARGAEPADPAGQRGGGAGAGEADAGVRRGRVLGRASVGRLGGSVGRQRRAGGSAAGSGVPEQPVRRRREQAS